MNREDLKYFQSMPLDIKVAMTQTRIREWVNYYGQSGTYISFSGGKDSTVLLHLVRDMYPDIEAVFVNTGLEYPEIQSFAKSFDNVTVLTPTMPFNEVVKKYGYPFISKEVSHVIYEGKRYDEKTRKYQYCIDRLNGIGNYSCEKYKPLLSVDFNLSHLCCNVMKKSPAKKYEHLTEKTPFVGTLTEESRLRETEWIRNGCNAFESKRPRSAPMSFWTENDILKYIHDNNIEIASVYGSVELEYENGQLTLEDLQDFADGNCKYHTTGCDRTGCMFCGFGAHRDKYSRFLRLKETHPKQYNYCINGGEYDIDGFWKPNKNGLGLGHVIDKLNELYSKNGKAFIEY